MRCLTYVDEFPVNKKNLFLSHQSFGACFISGKEDMADGAGGAANIEDCRRLLIGQNPIEYCCNTGDEMQQA